MLRFYLADVSAVPNPWSLKSYIDMTAIQDRHSMLLKKKKKKNFSGYIKLLVAPSLTTRSKKLLGAKGIATRSKDATSSS